MNRFATARSMPDAEEQSLARRARAHDPEALGELYRQHRGALFRHAYRMLGDETAAHDVVQEAFARGLAAIGRTREELRFKAWIFRIATNLCLRRLTVRKRWVSSEGRPAALSTAKEGDPEASRRRREIADFVVEALDAIPPRYRQVLLLREVEELRYEELSKVLEISVSRVKIVLHRARSRFSAEFIAARILADSDPQITCDALAGLVKADADRRALVRHLEGCKTCRRRDRRPAAELFAVLPAIPSPPASAPPLVGATQAPSSSLPPEGPPGTLGVEAATGTLGVKTLLLAVAATAGLATVAFFALSQRDGATPSPDLGAPQGTAVAVKSMAQAPAKASSSRQVAKKTSGSERHSGGAELFTSSSHLTAPSSQNAGAVATKMSGPAPHGGHPRRAGTGARRNDRHSQGDRRGGTGAPLSLRPLALRVASGAGPVTVLRGPRRFSLRLAQDLRVGDVLQASPGRSFGLRLPGDAWVGVAGALRLDRVPRRGEGRSQIRLTLISGRLRARATARMGGLAIGLGPRELRFERGMLRVQKMPHGGLRVETLRGTYATVLGAPRACGARRRWARSVSPMTSLTFIGAQDLGAARALRGAPSGLRPARSRHERPPRLAWDAVAWATTYAVELALDADFLEVVRSYHVTTSSVTPRGLSPGAYYWHVLASDGAQRGHGSKVYRFIVLASP